MPELLTLSEVSRRTKISMPTLQRYKREYQRRIPSVGKGRKQRYPAEALEVFQAIKKENLGRRGRRRRAVADTARGRGGRAAGRRRGGQPATGGLLTLTEIAKRTGISYRTLLRDLKHHLDRLPHEGAGRRRRFHPEAVEVFRGLREEGGRAGTGGGRKVARGGRARAAGRPGRADGGLEQRLAALATSQAALTRSIEDLLAQLRRPLTVTLGRGR